MFFIPDNRRLRERPNYPRPLNRGHYAVDNLLVAHAFTIDQNRSSELVSGRPASIVGNSRAFNGSGFYFTAANTASMSGISQTIVSTRQAYTLEIIGVFSSQSVTISFRPYFLHNLSLIVGATYSVKERFGVYDGVWRYTSSYTPFAGTNVYRHLVFTLFDGGYHRFYENGELKESISAGSPINLASTSQFFYRNATETGKAFNPINCYFQYAALHNGCFSADDARDRYENPWAIFEPRRDVLYFFPATVPPARRINSLFRGRPF